MTIIDHGAGSSQDRRLESAALGRVGALAAVIFVEIDEALDHNPVKARDGLRRLDQVLRLLPIWPQDRENCVSPKASTTPSGGLAPWQLRRVDAMINERMEGPLYVESLAAQVRLSQSHFCRAFKISTGETPHAYIMGKRLDRARSLMLESDESLSQIAGACGLADQAHLSRLFRRRFGVTPWKWRRARRSEAVAQTSLAAGKLEAPHSLISAGRGL
ncbi:MAG: helix-turn-helix domain-containing protein [Brevundimonas sp.]